MVISVNGMEPVADGENKFNNLQNPFTFPVSDILIFNIIKIRPNKKVQSLKIDNIPTLLYCIILPF